MEAIAICLRDRAGHPLHLVIGVRAGVSWVALRSAARLRSRICVSEAVEKPCLEIIRSAEALRLSVAGFCGIRTSIGSVVVVRCGVAKRVELLVNLARGVPRYVAAD